MSLMKRGAGRVRAAVLAACLLGVAYSGTAQAQVGYTQTRYPLVLAHGLGGFGNIGPIEYWFGIPAALREGGARVFVTQQSATNSSEVRGEQLLAQLLQLKAAYGYGKFNLVGHSHGGQSVRYVASVRPDLVASVTTVGTPNLGGKLGDVIEADAIKNGNLAETYAFINAISGLISALGGGPQLPQDTAANFASLSASGAAAFNQRHPEGAPATPCGSGPAIAKNGVRYFSIAGTAIETNMFDPSDSFLKSTSAAFAGEPSDGLVTRCSAHWGMVLRDDYPWNHLDEVNQVFGLRGPFTPDPLAFYRSQANRLKSLGL